MRVVAAAEPRRAPTRRAAALPRHDAGEREADRAAAAVLRGLPPQIGRVAGPGDGQPRPPGLGRPLDADARRYFEQRFGHDFAAIRVHDDPAAQHSAATLGARAYAWGQHVVLGAGASQLPATQHRWLMAHELAHTVQQRDAAPRVQRLCTEDDCDGASQSSASAATAAQVGAGAGSTAFLGAGWRQRNEPGVIYKAGGPSEGGGAFLRDEPLGAKLGWLAQNTRVHVLAHDPVQRWFAVVAEGAHGGVGYVADWLVALNPPDPNSAIVKVQPGDTPIALAERHYKRHGFTQWGEDLRYVVNALVWINAHARHNFKGAPALAKRDVDTGFVRIEGTLDAPWWATQAQAGGYLWLPGPAYLRSVYEQVAKHGGGTGSLSADMWRGLKKIYHYAAYGLAFIGGIAHGFLKSLVDAIAGLASMVYGMLKSLLTWSVAKDIEELAKAFSSLKMADIKDAVGAWAEGWSRKLESQDPWTAGHAHGYLTGYVMAEAAMLLISGGTLAAAKGALWTSRLGKALQASAAVRKVAAGVDKARRATGPARKVMDDAAEALAAARQRADAAAQAALKVARDAAGQVAGDVMKWVLKLPPETIAQISAEAAQRLMSLGKEALERIGEVSPRAKRWLLGCASPCKVEANAIRRWLRRLSNADIEAFVNRIDDAAETPLVKGRKIDERRVPRKPRRRLDAEDIPRIGAETLEQAIGRIHTVIGRTVGSHPALRDMWLEASRQVLQRHTLTRGNAARLYELTRNRFWTAVRNEPSLFREAGFALPRTRSRAPYLKGVRRSIPDAEITVSLDHAAEKAIGSNWRLALDPDNLVFEFQGPNSWREIVQMRHPSLRP